MSSAITISSSEALPARSPMPLMVHSTCRAPAMHRRQAVGHGHAQVVVAVNGDDGLVDVGHVLEDAADQRPELVRGGVADRVRDVDRGGAGRDGDLQRLVQEVRVGAGGVHGRELHVHAVALGPAVPWRGSLSSASSRLFWNWCTRWMSEVDMKVWILGVSASRIASQARSMSSGTARARPHTTTPFKSLAIRRTASKSPGR